MKWDQCFSQICNSLFRIEVTSSSGTRIGTGFAIAKFREVGKLELAIATARHMLENLPGNETIYWVIQKFDLRGNLIVTLKFESNFEQVGKNPFRFNLKCDIGVIFIPKLENVETKILRLINPGFAVEPGAKVGWAGYPLFTKIKTIRTHPCYFEGVISTVIDTVENEFGILYYLVDGHGGQGVSGGPLWYWNDEKENYEVLGICSQYIFPEQKGNLPGMVVFESINPLVVYLQDSNNMDLDI